MSPIDPTRADKAANTHRPRRASKGDPPKLPILHAWHDEALGGAINPAPEPVADDAREPDRKTAALKPPVPPKRTARAKKAEPESAPVPKKRASEVATQNEAVGAVPLAIIQRLEQGVRPPQRKLALGAAPPAPSGESCNIRDVLVASETEQKVAFEAMHAAADSEKAGGAVQAAITMLCRLSDAFGDDEGRTT